MYKSVIVKEFSRFAHSYDSYNIIQRDVAKELITRLPQKNYENIVDIGCGSGVIYKYIQDSNITMDKFIALDSSANMLAIHPSSSEIEKYQINFDDENALNALKVSKEALLLSSSALQWSQDLDRLLLQLSTLTRHAHFSIFTANTFKTLHKSAQLDSPIYCSEVLKKTIIKYYDAKFELKTYKLYFDTVREMFQYIKRSGVSGGEKQLGFKEIKALMHSYPLDYLEFEVLFVSTVSPAKSK